MNAAIISIFGFTINMMSVAIFAVFIGLLVMFVRIQLSEKLDFTDMLTKDGRSVSLTKVLQLLGGITATWVVVKTTMGGSLDSNIFAIYLTYVASIEGFSKFMAAKYNYTEKSVRDVQSQDSQTSQSTDQPTN